MLRGDVYRLQVPRRIGHEQQGDRYGVVVQADAFLPRSVVIVAPTSRSARTASFRPEIEVAGDTTRVLVEQVGAVDASRLGELAGHLAPEEMWGIDDALATVLDLR
ncbi:MAG TPA: type II toxin-antitoxin system PemK/MazF family toxin [Acidimicrobiales bacterium]|nr:type II toxin-antitoxin system PemK/MazF family toxin [Acidimicrobiales bacterium]